MLVWVEGDPLYLINLASSILTTIGIRTAAHSHKANHSMGTEEASFIGNLFVRIHTLRKAPYLEVVRGEESVQVPPVVEQETTVMSWKLNYLESLMSKFDSALDALIPAY